jgi:hypothetical protein
MHSFQAKMHFVSPHFLDKTILTKLSVDSGAKLLEKNKLMPSASARKSAELDHLANPA